MLIEACVTLDPRNIKSHKYVWKIKITEFYTIKGMSAAYMCKITEIQKDQNLNFLS